MTAHVNIRRTVAWGAVIVGLLFLPYLMPNTYALHLVNLVLLYTIVALGLNLISGVAGQVSLGHAAFMAIGAYVASIMTTRADFPFGLGVVAATAGGALAGVVVGWFSLHLTGPYFAMATIGVGEIIRLVLINWETVSGGPSGIYGIPGIAFGPLVIGDELKFYYLILIAASAVYVFCQRLVFSRFGRSLLAIREHEGAARAAGVDTTRTKILAFGISTALAGFAGALHAHWINYINPDMYSFTESLMLLSMILVGGAGTLPGTLLGTALLTLTSEALRFLQDYRLAVYAVTIYGVIAFKPEGLVGFLPLRWRGAARYPEPADGGSLYVVPRTPRDRATGVGERNNPEPVLIAKGITKRFGGITALNRVDFDLRPGEIHALIGPNGSGKTTLLNVLAGWCQPDEGAVLFQREDITRWPVHERARLGIGRTFQNILLFNDMTVLENVLVPLGHIDLTEPERIARGYMLLETVGLKDMADQPARSLPYGKQRKLEIARALALSPAVLLLDEPAAGMNDRETDELKELLYALRDWGYTLLIVEHDMRLVMSVADRITVFNYGARLAEGTAEEISRNPAVIEAYLGRRGIRAIG